MKKRKLVLIAGSMGSFEPLRTIISALPINSNLSFIVLQHQDPAHKSRLPGIIRNWTSIPCSAIKANTELLPGHIYVSASGEQLETRDGQLFLLSSSLDKERRTHTIDDLAMTLASHPEVQVAFVVLSGYGHDGVRGANAVHKSGGLVIAQAPLDSQASSMPGAIIEQKIADEVLNAADIVSSLIRFSASASPNELPLPIKIVVPKDQDLRRLTQLLQSQLGKDFSQYKEGTLSRRVARRVSMRELESVEEYITLYRNDLEELQHLADDLLIGVTSFFRDTSAFDIIRKKVLPELLAAEATNDEFRAWVIGCSTGEEAYTLAMLVHDFQRENNLHFSVKIFATDADAAALDFARVGAYGKEAVSAVPPVFLSRYFNQIEKCFVVCKEIRQMVVFASHNVITDSPFSQLDMIICRNLLIYLNDKVKSALLRLFHFSLRKQGILFLGSAESVGRADRHFNAISKKWRIYRRSAEAPTKRPSFPLIGRSGSIALGMTSTTKDLPAVLKSEGLLRRLLESHGASQLLIDGADRLIYSIGDISPYLHFPTGEPSENLLEIIQPSLHAAIRALLNRTRQSGHGADSSLLLLEGLLAGESLTATGKLIASEGFENCVAITLSRTGKQSQRPADDTRNQAQWTIDLLRQEVDATREDMQRTINQARNSEQVLREANEEIVVMNEELQSANEELEASKEEMQSLNDELISSNNLLDIRVRQIETLNRDLSNLLDSSDTATLIVDSKRRIKHFTPNLSTLMKLRDSDIGRDVGDIARSFDDEHFLRDIGRCLIAKPVADVEVHASDNREMIRRLLPYKDEQSRIRGVIANFIDITELQKMRTIEQENSFKLTWQNSLLDKAAPILGRTIDGSITYWNKSAQMLWGYTKEEAIGKNTHTLLKTVFQVGEREPAQMLLEHGHWHGVVSQTTKSGKDVELSVHWTLSPAEESTQQLVSEVYQDLSLTMKLKGELREEQELFHLLLDWTADAEYWANEDGHIDYVTPAIEDITGYRPQEFIDNPELLEGLVQSEQREEWLRHLSRQDSPPANQWKSITVCLTRRDGAEIWVNHRYKVMYSSESDILGYRGSLHDVSERHRLEAEAELLAFSDTLTGLPNRRKFMQRLEEACVISGRSRRYGALVMLDLDSFKRVNDTEGHDVGDELLVEVGKRLRARLRAFDTIARVGGDEFMLILNSLGADELGASLVARRICSEVARDLATEHALPNASRLHHITGSFGIAMFLANDKPLATLLKQADMALYSAKNLGRNKVKLFNQDMQTSVDLRMEAETALIVACGSDDLTLYYQVLVDENGNPRGAEALLRWKKPDGYIATPTDFMEVLEEQPLVGTIGRRVLEQSMRQLKRWESNKALQRLDMSINISAGHLLSDQFTKDVEELLASTGANPRRIILELTENTLIMETDRICRLLEQLTRRGLRFSLDDFGTGYSSLTHLREMPLAQLKIDKSFVEGLPHSAKCQSIVNSVVAVGKSMKLEIVAEGVETQEQYDYLKKIGCNRYQGFFFGHPVPAESFLSD